MVSIDPTCVVHLHPCPQPLSAHDDAILGESRTLLFRAGHPLLAAHMAYAVGYRSTAAGLLILILPQTARASAEVLQCERATLDSVLLPWWRRHYDATITSIHTEVV